MRLATAIALLSLVVACKREERALHTDSVQTMEDRVHPQDSARPASDTARMEREVPWECRSELVGHSYEHSIEQTYVGVFREQKLYAEVWHVYHNAGTSCDYILLRTDSVWNDSFDLCLPQADQTSLQDTVLVERLDSTDSYRPANLTVHDVPGLFQVLRYGDYGYQNYSMLNEDNEQRIYIKGNSLFIQHWDSPRYDDATLRLERYDYHESRKMFIYKSVKILKTEPSK